MANWIPDDIEQWRGIVNHHPIVLMSDMGRAAVLSMLDEIEKLKRPQLPVEEHGDTITCGRVTLYLWDNGRISLPVDWNGDTRREVLPGLIAALTYIERKKQ